MLEAEKFDLDVAANWPEVGAEAVRLPELDRDWYLKRYPEVAQLQMKPETHYTLYGHRLGRDPSPDFPTRFYRTLLKTGPRQSPLRLLQKLSVDGEVAKSPAIAGRVLMAAEQLSQEGDTQRALSLAQSWLPMSQQYRADIIRANLAAERGNETAWVEATNRYLRHFGVGAVRLSGKGSLFDRIDAAGHVPAVDGPKISVLVAVWNSETTVAKALNSLLEQSWRNVELLVIDDCSTDDTWSIIKAIAAKDQRVRIWRNPESVGPYVSKSLAAAYATGEWITGHDGDGWAHPERIARQVQFCLDNKVDACMSGMLRIAENGEYTRLSEVSEFIYDGACRRAPISLLMRTQLFNDLLGSWDQVRAGGDSELLGRLEKVTGKRVQHLTVPTMFCLDRERSDDRFASGVAQDCDCHRIAHKRSYLKIHKKLTKLTSRYDFPAARLRYASSHLQVPVRSVLAVARQHGPVLRQDVQADIVIITTLRFPGGNASSTLDEVRYFRNKGLKVALVHCPIDSSLGRGLSERYADCRGILYQWSRVGSIRAKVLICRHPRVLVSQAFRKILPRISAEHAFIVKNNSYRRPNGEVVYNFEEMLKSARALRVGSLEFCPISLAMRKELIRFSHQLGSLPISQLDWTPTFDADQYYHPPKHSMEPPYRIGRHARDGREKWRERPDELLQAYPSATDFRIHILGGADKAADILGKIPENWHVRDFGNVEPLAFLRELDAFVYFPNSKLVEGFGRTIVEAMIAGVPVVVPSSLEATFGDLAIICEPKDVQRVVRRLAEHPEARVAYLKEVQRLAIARYGADVIAQRLVNTDLGIARSLSERPYNLSKSSQMFRSMILSGL